MTRALTAGMVTEVTGVLIRPIVLIKFEFDSGELNLWSGVGTLSWNGDTYTGGGNALSVGRIRETQDVIANSVDFTISGISSSIISTALSEDYQGRAVTMWYGAFDSSKAVIADPIKIFAGIMDVMTISESGGTSIITVTAESQLRSLRQPSARKWTPADQKVLYPTDKGFDEVDQIQDDPIRWGS